MIGRATRSRMADGRTLKMVSGTPQERRYGHATAPSDQRAIPPDEQRPTRRHRVA